MTQVHNGLTDLQAGKLLADIEHVKDEQAEQKLLLREIIAKLDDRVTRDEFEQYKKEHEEQIKERYPTNEDIRALLNFWRLITSNVAKVFAVAIVGVAIYATSQMVSQTQFINQLKADVNNNQTKEGL